MMKRTYKTSYAKKRAAGSKAKHAGNYFECLLEFHSVRAKIKLVKIPTGCKITYFQGKLKPVLVKTPFDYVLAKNGISIYIDCKTIESGNFTHSKIDTNQMDNLLDLENQRHTAGYVIYYREVNRVVFYKASVLKQLQRGDSLKETNGIFIGDNQSMNLNILFNLQIDQNIDLKSV